MVNLSDLSRRLLRPRYKQVCTARNKDGTPVFKVPVHKGPLWVDPTTDADRARIQGPSLSFRTNRPPLRTFSMVLRDLDNAHFDWVWTYCGPELDLQVEEGQLPSVEVLLDRMEKAQSKDIPMGGLRASLAYRRYQRIRAKVRVTGDDRSKVRVKVKGPVLRSDWMEFRRMVRKHFNVEL